MYFVRLIMHSFSRSAKEAADRDDGGGVAGMATGAAARGPVDAGAETGLGPFIVAARGLGTFVAATRGFGPFVPKEGGLGPAAAEAGLVPVEAARLGVALATARFA